MQDKLTEQQLRESLQGFDTKSSFSEAMQQALVDSPPHHNESIYRTERKAEVAQALDIGMPPQALPFAITEMSAEQIDEVKASADPFLKVWSTAYRLDVENGITLNSQPYIPTPHERQIRRALLETLPVLHATSVEAVTSAMRTGHFRSNRALHEQGEDMTLGRGMTNSIDRDLGLDNYIFGDFGRFNSERRSEQSDVVVVFEPSVMDVPGTFLTEHDLQDSVMWFSGDNGPDVQKYIQGAVLPEDFYAVAETRLERMDSTYDRGDQSYSSHSLEYLANGHDAQPTNILPSTFSTWEVKLPGATTNHIRKLLFTDAEKHAAFVAEFGDAVPSELVDPEHIAAGRGHEPVYKYEDGKYVEVRLPRMQTILGTDQKMTERLTEIRETDFAEREAVVTEMGDAAIKGYMLLHDPSHFENAPDLRLADPRMYAVRDRVYLGLDSLRAGVRTLSRQDENACDYFDLIDRFPNVYDYDQDPNSVDVILGVVPKIVGVKAVGDAAIVVETGVDFDVATLDAGSELRAEGYLR